jgi:hypothetical protein
MRLYAIISIEYINLINWLEVMGERDTVRKSLDGTKFLVSFFKEYQAELESLTDTTSYNGMEIENIINTPEWTIDDGLDEE